ncbi:SDR family oxidoreductase [Rosenbergiella sp. S61]|uniref:SDR family oxidoreductase n=1 Tax=Rosenbergiella gaditana TaxID=2726987 RepID=A0ABS5T019_9GAMM|nr:SDR family oxidoreductase [Rosenbergiella gaditana]MBT0725705.1 SDR family oxidoreductase [Rosenbergiella gaditana]
MKKVSFVTGGSKGIGAAVCRELASNGDYVFIGYSNSEDEANKVKTDILEKGGECEIIKIDVSNENDINSAYEYVKNKVSKIDKLACCAGVEDFSSLFDISKNRFDHVFGINTFGQFKCTSLFSNIINEGGAIVLTSSVSAKMTVREHMLYASSKAAVESFVKNASLELGDKGIKINAIAPGAVATGMAAGNAHKYIPKGLNIELKDWKGVNSACKRIGNVQEIAKAYNFLLSDSVPFMTGSTMNVDGGRI